MPSWRFKGAAGQDRVGACVADPVDSKFRLPVSCDMVASRNGHGVTQQADRRSSIAFVLGAKSDEAGRP
jgi:hypothetical protein